MDLSGSELGPVARSFLALHQERHRQKMLEDGGWRQLHIEELHSHSLSFHLV
jgi:hypothetical protein